MKKALLLLTSAFFILSFQSDEIIKDYIGLTGPIEFDGKKFELAWSSKSNNYYLQEYLIAGDTLEKFHEMILVNVINEGIDIDEVVQMKEWELEATKEIDPICNYLTTPKTDKTGAIVDFLRGESDGEIMKIVEFNTYRFEQITIGKNKKAVLLFAYCKRAYDKDIMHFLNTLKSTREEYIDKIGKVKVPTIHIGN